MIAYQIYRGVMMFLDIMSWLLFIYWILSWFRPNFKLYDMLESFMAPLMRPFRELNMKLMARMRAGRMMDFSYILAMLAIRICRYVVNIVFFRFIL